MAITSVVGEISMQSLVLR